VFGVLLPVLYETFLEGQSNSPSNLTSSLTLYLMTYCDKVLKPNVSKYYF